MIGRKTKQGGISKGKAGAAGGLVTLVVWAANKWLGWSLVPDDVALVVGGLMALISMWGSRVAVERVEQKLEE